MDSINTPPQRPPLSNPAILMATWFGSGYLAKAPGTWGSLAALPFAWALQTFGGNWALVAGILIVFVLGLWSSAVFMKISESHDPGQVVIDEVAGQWIVLLAATSDSWAGFAPDAILYALGFFLFRLLDILKPWPISWADKKISGAMGVMIDDVLAGFAGLVIMMLAINLLG